jgi:hypothetical protein
VIARGLDFPANGTREDTLQMISEGIREREQQLSDVLVFTEEAAINS